MDSSGNAWVTNQDSNTVTKLSSSGSTLGTFNVGTGPYSIAIDRSNPVVWVVNTGSSNVTKLSTGGSFGILVRPVRD